MDYHKLKDKLKHILKLDPKAPKPAKDELQKAFQAALDQELEKVSSLLPVSQLLCPLRSADDPHTLGTVDVLEV